MNISKNSNTYKFLMKWSDYSFMFNLENGKINFCQFWRTFFLTLLFAFLMYSVFTIFLLTVVLALFSQIAAINHLFGEDISYLLIIPSGESLLFLGYVTLFVEICIFCMIMLFKLLKKTERKIKSFNLTPITVIKTGYRSWKDKYCPTVKVE